MAERALPAPEIWAEARRRETGRDAARDAAVAALDAGLWERPILETLHAMVLRQPDHPAIVDAGRAISYGAFWNLIGAYTAILRAADAPAGPVAVLAGDHIIAAAALFACLGAGRPCLPLDASSPMTHHGGAVRSAGVAIVALGPAEARADVAASGIAEGRVCVALTRDGESGGGWAPGPVAAIGVDEPAFILPTSGTTGRPKLIVRSQRAMAYFAALFTVHLRPDDHVMTASGPPCSYSGMKYLFAPLFLGGSLHCADIRQHGMRRYLDRFADEKITVFRTGPSLLRMLSALPRAREALAGLRFVHLGGEPTLQSDIAPWRAVLPAGCMIENRYGPTEGITLYWAVRAGDDRDPVRVPIGFAEPGSEAVILDADGALCPPGTVGELAIRSRYTALGEWVDGRCVPGRLIPDPDVPGSRVYFTGDLARAGADGCVVVLGRMDRMLKINGQRVEPMEVEGAIWKLADVLDVIVLPRMMGQSASLVAFVVARPGLAVNARDLRESLRAHVPAHMLPSRIVVVDTLPRLASGKVDGVTLLAGLGATTDG